MAVADFNGDGKPDLAVVNAGNGDLDGGNVSILLGNGDGTFQPANNIAAGKSPVSIAVGDFNGDDRPDLAVGNTGDGGSVSVLLGNGDGTFQSAKPLSVEGAVFSLAVGDFDGDLRPDLALPLPALAPSQPKVAVFLGNGDGTFRRGEDILNMGGSILASDFNGDHKVDVVVGGAILLGNGDGTFQPGLALGLGFFTSASPTSVGDFNRDGKLDLVMGVTRFHGESFDAVVDVLLGNGDGTFQAASDVVQVSGGEFLLNLFAAAGDFNGDTSPALVVAERSHQPGFAKRTVDVFLGNGDGTFQPPVSFDTNAHPIWVSVADLNADQAPDLVTANPSDNTVSVLLNTTGADFSISASAPNPGTVSRGQSSTSTVTLNLLNAFDNPVALTCSVQPTQAAPTCSLSPNSVTFDANGNATATLTINTGSATASLVPASLRQDSRSLHFLWLPVAGFALMGAGFGSSRSTRSKLTVYLLGGMLFGGLIFQAACGGSGGPGSTAYTITVTGTSGSTQHSTTTTLTVQ